MGDLWEGVKRMLGMIGPRRAEPPIQRQPEDDEKASKDRLADQKEREEARRRVAALDIRVDVLTRRMHKHEQRPHR